MNRFVLTAAVLAVLAAGAFAQALPDFSGKWTMVPDPNVPAGGGRGGFGGLGQTATITQDAATLVITRTTQAGEFTTTYRLDDAESRNTLNIQGNTIEQLSKARWEDGRLIVNTTLNFGGTPAEVSMTMSLDEAGNLVVVTTRPDFQGGSAPITTKTIYKKG